MNGTITGNISVFTSSVTPDFITNSSVNALFYTTVNLSDSIRNALNWSELRIYYNDSMLGSINKSTLRMAYYNSSTGLLINISAGVPSFVFDTGVDTANSFVWANVSGFSTYALVGDEEQSSSTSGSSGGGGGGSSGGGGGGGAYVSSVPDNTYTKYLRFLSAGSTINFSVSKTQIPVVLFTALLLSDAPAASITLSTNNTAPYFFNGSVSSVTNIIYSGLSLSDESVILSLSASSNDSLFLWGDGDWVAADWTLISSNNTNKLFLAETKGSSWLLLGAKAAVSYPDDVAEDIVTDLSSEAVLSNTTNSSAVSYSSDRPLLSWKWAFAIVLLLVVIVITTIIFVDLKSTNKNL